MYFISQSLIKSFSISAVLPLMFISLKTYLCKFFSWFCCYSSEMRYFQSAVTKFLNDYIFMEFFIQSMVEVEGKQFFSKEVTCWTYSRALVLFRVVRICLHKSLFVLQLPDNFEYKIKKSLWWTKRVFISCFLFGVISLLEK